MNVETTKSTQPIQPISSRRVWDQNPPKPMRNNATPESATTSPQKNTLGMLSKLVVASLYAVPGVDQLLNTFYAR